MSKVNRYNGISEEHYKDIREAVKNNPQRKQHINNILKQELEHGGDN